MSRNFLNKLSSANSTKTSYPSCFESNYLLVSLESETNMQVSLNSLSNYVVALGCPSFAIMLSSMCSIYHFRFGSKFCDEFL